MNSSHQDGNFTKTETDIFFHHNWLKTPTKTEKKYVNKICIYIKNKNTESQSQTDLFKKILILVVVITDALCATIFIKIIISSRACK